MPFFRTTDGVTLHYVAEGEGKPVLVIHGFASNIETNWRAPSWFSTLKGARRMILAMDVRGHGQSEKPHDAALYDEARLARDAVELLDHCGIKSCDVMGYSMGAFITIKALVDHPDRFARVILAGIGENYFAPLSADVATVSAAMLAPSLDGLTNPVARMFRRFAEAQGNDLIALGACFSRPRRSESEAQLAQLVQPVLVSVGEKDTITGSGARLARAFARGQLFIVPGRDHMSAVGDKAAKAVALRFLEEGSEAAA
ncbi:MAG: alpha/beta hydrolase [Alphaproteobacteria bacterium]|nr:alpha/beta hydrolase [Alphaproteobacteria bacterium]